MNDPDHTMILPVVEARDEPNGGVSPRSAFFQGDAASRPEDKIIPPKDTNMNHPRTAGAEQSRFDPTVFGAVRRYRGMVVAVAILFTVAAMGYSLLQPKVYRAQALITMPQQVSLQNQQANPGQYLDGQVLILQSQNVAQLAATIANTTLHSKSLIASDFFGSGSTLQISPPPTTAAPGAYGATVIGVSFAASTAQIAQAGTNAVLQAYNQTRSAAIRSQDNAAITGIDNAIGGTNYQLTALSGSGSTSPAAANMQQQLLAQRADLITQRTQAIVNEQIDLAQQPAVASEPAATANHKWALDGGIGLVIGILLGCALAFVRAGRRRTAASSKLPSQG